MAVLGGAPRDPSVRDPVLDQPSVHWPRGETSQLAGAGSAPRPFQAIEPSPDPHPHINTDLRVPRLVDQLVSDCGRRYLRSQAPRTTETGLHTWRGPGPRPPTPLLSCGERRNDGSAPEKRRKARGDGYPFCGDPPPHPSSALVARVLRS
jgi:hypothetical protein